MATKRMRRLHPGGKRWASSSVQVSRGAAIKDDMRELGYSNRAKVSAEDLQDAIRNGSATNTGQRTEVIKTAQKLDRAEDVLNNHITIFQNASTTLGIVYRKGGPCKFIQVSAHGSLVQISCVYPNMKAAMHRYKIKRIMWMQTIAADAPT